MIRKEEIKWFILIILKAENFVKPFSKEKVKVQKDGTRCVMDGHHVRQILTYV